MHDAGHVVRDDGRPGREVRRVVCDDRDSDIMVNFMSDTASLCTPRGCSNGRWTDTPTTI